MITCLILFIAGGYRAFTLYKTYHSYENEVQSIEAGSKKNISNVLTTIIEENHDLIEYTTKMDATTLHRLMVESMSMDEIYDNIVDYCVEQIEQGNYEKAYSRYKNSVLALEEQFINCELENNNSKILKRTK